MKSYKPNVNNLRIFGCSAYAHIPKDERSKMDPKAKKSIFLGYGIGVKGYRLFDTETHRKSSIAEMSYLMKQHLKANREQKKLKINL